jgi:hypothetical protein
MLSCLPSALAKMSLAKIAGVIFQLRGQRIIPTIEKPKQRHDTENFDNLGF